MKKTLVSLLLSFLLLLTLTACGRQPQPSGGTGSGTGLETAPDLNSAEPFAFVLNGVTVTPGKLLDLESLPEPDSLTQVPSCAFEGEDNIYAFGDVEITTHAVDDGELVYSVYFMSSAVATPEGVTNGDPLSKVTDTYGLSYTQVVSEISYERDGVLLLFIVRDDAVISIEYRVAD